MKSIYRFLISLNTLFGILAVCIALAFVGSITLPSALAFFSGIDDTPLFEWLSESGNIKATWWIYVFIVALALLAASMVFCIADDLLKVVTRSNLIQKLSPQLIHAGTLFVLLGYLLTSAYGVRSDVLLKMGDSSDLSPVESVYVEGLRIDADEQGYYTDWEASLRFIRGDSDEGPKVLRPAHPVYAGGYGFYFKSISMGDEPAALIRVCRDPGVSWALLGGFLLITGAAGVVYCRLRL